MSKRFSVALSFAGEKREFVSAVAAILADRFGRDRILYDQYHQAELSRSDLAFHLPLLYHDESDLVVAVLCGDYETKEWCGLEWNAIYGMIMQRRQVDVMLCRFDRVEAKGLYGLAGFVDVDDKQPGEVAALIAERLALNEGRPRDYYSRDNSPGPAWPDAPPPLDWRVADHREAQHAFAQLVTSGAPFRLLPVYGSTDTGKTHLTKQFLRNGLKIEGLTCGRFDFKGSADFDAELRAFADRLGVQPPAAGAGVSPQLGQIFAQIKRAGRPALLIFDTFELAGDAERWVKDNLLTAMIQAPWLRVIVAGQRTTVPYGEAWEEYSSKPIELRPPSPEEWFAYGQHYNSSPEFTLEMVRFIHERTKGQSSVIAQIFGPTG